MCRAGIRDSEVENRHGDQGKAGWDELGEQHPAQRHSTCNTASGELLDRAGELGEGLDSWGGVGGGSRGRGDMQTHS